MQDVVYLTLTIEYDGVIPEAVRPLMGNRIYGCDDCQLICPWNQKPLLSTETDFTPRYNLDSISLLALYQWDESTFLTCTEGSAIHRIGYEKWIRNITVALGNVPYNIHIMNALYARLGQSNLVDEHIQWSLTQQHTSRSTTQKQKRLLRQLNKH